MGEAEDDLYAQGMLALLGLRHEQPKFGVRVLMRGAFHDGVCVSVDQQQGVVEYHRLPMEIEGAQLCSQRGVKLALNPAELGPVEHLQDIAELPPEAWRSLSCAIEAIPASERSSHWDWHGRDGASVRVECFYRDRVEVIGVYCRLGNERPNHKALVCTMLEIAHDLFPEDRPHLRNLLRCYFDRSIARRS